MLPHLAKNIVMAMLYMPAPFEMADLETWVRPDGESAQKRDNALSILQRLRILEEEGRAYKLSHSFAKSLRLALTGGGHHRSFGVPSTHPDEKPVTVAYLDTIARKQWEGILYYVVGSANAGLGGEEEISAGTKQLLQNGEFVRAQGRTSYITEKGFEFLLQEVNAQIWTLLIVYLELAGEVSRSSLRVVQSALQFGCVRCMLMDGSAVTNGPCGCPILPFHPWLPRTRHIIQHYQPHPYTKTNA